MSEVEQLLLEERRGDVLLLTLNRPAKHNALSAALVHALGSAVRRADDDGVAVIVLTGAGNKAFCAGADMLEASGVAASTTSANDAQHDGAPPRIPSELRIDGYAEVAATPIPIIAAINGLCYGGGARLAISCDIRLAVDTATFRLPGAEYGLVVGAATLPRLVGTSRAKDWIYTARKFDAAEALLSGLVSGLFAADALLPAAMSMAQTIAGHSQSAVRESKRVIDAATLHDEAVAMEDRANRVLRGSKEQSTRFRAATRKVTGR